MRKKDLRKIRDEIDMIDGKIRRLLEKRFSLAVSAVSFKKTLRDPKREKEITYNLCRGLKNRDLKKCFEKIYSEILRQSIIFQRKNDNKDK